MRLFIGIELPDWIKNQLLAVQMPLSGARWQGADQLHLTLSFLGEVNDQQVPAIQRALADLMLSPFALRLNGIHSFGSAKRPRLLWAGVTPEAPVVALHTTVETLVRSLGFPGEDSPRFQPHITLARMGRSPGDASAFLQTHHDFASAPFDVTRIALFQSVIQPSGSAYQVLDRFPHDL